MHPLTVHVFGRAELCRLKVADIDSERMVLLLLLVQPAGVVRRGFDQDTLAQLLTVLEKL